MTTIYSNANDVPLALAVFLASDFYDRDDDPNTISATTLLKPIRQIILPPRIPSGSGLIDLATMFSNRIGAAIHDGIEKAWITNHRSAMQAMGYPKHIIDRVVINPETPINEDDIPIYMEQRLKRQLGNWIITGKFDFIAEGRVQDFKSTSVWTYLNQVNSNKYALQGSIYRWLNPELITDDQMDIHYIFLDWKQSQAKYDPKYPSKRFLKQTFDLLSLAETNQFIQERLNLIERYWNADETDIPYCTDEDLWRSEPVWKYYKNPAKLTRSTKNFTNKQDAYIRLAEDGNVGIVKEIPGQVTACKYCSAFDLCSQKDMLISSGDLILEDV